MSKDAEESNQKVGDKEDREQVAVDDDGQEETNSTCTICMEEWTIGSDHRLCCLKCGHLFGRSCIERWIKEKAAQAKCPTCNKPAKKSDIRDLWCKAIKAFDNTELTHLQQALNNERKLRKTDSAVIFSQNLKIEVLHNQLEDLKKVVIDRNKKIARMEGALLKIYKAQAHQATDSSITEVAGLMDVDLPSLEELSNDVTIEPKEMKGAFHMSESVESSPSGGCRSIALCPVSKVILVSQPAPSTARTVFGGFGLKKYLTYDTTLREFIPLHSKIITSIQLKPLGDLILTSSQDKKVKLTSIHNNTCVQDYLCQYEPTCVAWSIHRDQQFYVAFGNCHVALFDQRNTSEFIHQTSQRIANTRLLSIAATSDAESLHGLLVNDFKGSQFLEASASSAYDYENIDRSVEHLPSHQLPFDGTMGTVDFHKSTNMALITTRKTALAPNSTHNLVKLHKVQSENSEGIIENRVECQRVRTFTGGKSTDSFSQSRILKHPTVSDSVLVCATDNDARGIKLWDVSDNTEYQSIRTNAFIRDVVMFNPENSNQHILYTLRDRGLDVYKWDYA